MTDIVKKLIKDIDKPSKKSDYIFDYKNGYIMYRGVAIYKADTSMFNYDWIVQQGFKELDLKSFLNIDSKFIECEKEYLSEMISTKGKKILVSVYHSYDYLVKVDTKLEDVIQSDCYCRAYNNRTGVYYINKYDDSVEAYILSII